MINVNDVPALRTKAVRGLNSDLITEISDAYRNGGNVELVLSDHEAYRGTFHQMMVTNGKLHIRLNSAQHNYGQGWEDSVSTDRTLDYIWQYWVGLGDQHPTRLKILHRVRWQTITFFAPDDTEFN